MTARRLDERTGPCKGCPCVDLHCFRDKPSCSLCSSELVSNLITRLEEPHLTTSGRLSTHWITPYREQERVAGQNIERRRRQDIPVVRILRTADSAPKDRKLGFPLPERASCASTDASNFLDVLDGLQKFSGLGQPGEVGLQGLKRDLSRAHLLKTPGSGLHAYPQNITDYLRIT